MQNSHLVPSPLSSVTTHRESSPGCELCRVEFVGLKWKTQIEGSVEPQRNGWLNELGLLDAKNSLFWSNIATRAAKVQGNTHGVGKTQNFSYFPSPPRSFSPRLSRELMWQQRWAELWAQESSLILKLWMFHWILLLGEWIIFWYLLRDWFSPKAEFLLPEIFGEMLKSKTQLCKDAHNYLYNKNHFHQGWEQQGPFIPDLDVLWIWVCLALFGLLELLFWFIFHTEKSKSSFIFRVFSGLVAGWDLLLCFGSFCKGWNVPFAGAAEKIHRVLTKPGRETENSISPDMKIFSTSAHLCIHS